MSGEANTGKALTVTIDGASYARIPIRTRVVMPGDDLDVFVREHAADQVRSGDILSLECSISNSNILSF